MKPSPSTKTSRGYALILVLMFGTLNFVVLGSVLSWAMSNHSAVQRHNQYYRTAAAAEAATEKVVTAMTADYQSQGDVLVTEKQALYRGLVPTGTENTALGKFEFNNGAGQRGQTYLQYIPPTQYRVLDSQYRGLHGFATRYRIVSNARERDMPYDITVGVQQEVELATIPVFQFAIFYNTDLEVNPGAVMNITGPVHCNANIYLQPQRTLTFDSDVTSAGRIYENKKPGDPVSRSSGTIVFKGEHDALVSSLSLPIGTNNNPQAVREVVKVPPTNEPVSSALGKQRYYNKADMVILVSDSKITVKSGSVNNFDTVIPAGQYTNWLSTSTQFYNKREGKTVKATQLNISKLLQWNATNTLLRSILPMKDVRIVYVADQRSHSGSAQSGIRLVNGQTLLPKGLTVATPNPLYIQGNYNVSSAHLGTTNTSLTKPASIVADAITVLSPDWDDADGGKELRYRVASDCTVNAAFLAGIVPTEDGSYSGGVENFPRFLEDWGGRTFTYNGSMVVMFESQFATGPWVGTGETIGIYNPPTRNWAFDQNFRDVNKLAPGTPEMRALVRGKWAMVKPGSSGL